MATFSEVAKGSETLQELDKKIQDLQRRESEKRILEVKSKPTTILFKACEGESGEFAIKVNYFHIGKQRDEEGWVAVVAEKGMGYISASRVPFLREFPDGKKARKFPLKYPFIHKDIPDGLGDALRLLHEYESGKKSQNAQNPDQEKIFKKGTPGFHLTDLMKGGVGYAAIHFKKWKTPEGEGPLTLGIERKEEKGSAILMDFSAPNNQIDLSLLVGKPVENIPQLKKIIEYRLVYEAKQRGEIL